MNVNKMWQNGSELVRIGTSLFAALILMHLHVNGEKSVYKWRKQSV